MGNEAAGSNCSVKMKEPWLALWGSGGCQGSSSGACPATLPPGCGNLG